MQNSRSKLRPRSGLNLTLILLFTLALAACGFQLRGLTELSFKTIYIQGSPLSISKDLKQSLETNGVKVVDKVENAELLLELLSETNERKISALSGGGLVREIELNYRASFRTREPENPVWSAVQTVQTRRNFSYNDNALLGKLDEEARLNADMHKDAVREILRRLNAIKPTAK